MTNISGMNSSPPAASRLTSTQWLICIIASIGFAFDIYELLMLPLIIKPAIASLSAPLVQELVAGGMSPAEAGASWAPGGKNYVQWARLPGGKMWGEMKQNANALSGYGEAGMVKLFKLFKDATVKKTLPAVRLHLIGHSAGSIAHAYLGKRALDQGLTLASLALLAPAVRIDLFQRLLGEQLSARQIPMLIANLTDAAERNDDTCRPYGHSLLYLVSRSFEDHEETPLLGMEKHLVPALATSEWSQRVRQLHCPGGRWDGASAATRATTHGGLDDDEAVRQAVVDFIRAV